MLRKDPFPKQLLLNKEEVAQALGWDLTTLNDFLRDPVESRTFPKSKRAGKTRSGKIRQAWDKYKVYAWIELMPDYERENDPPARRNPAG